MNHSRFGIAQALIVGLTIFTSSAIAAPFSSGSTGADGAFAPTADAQVALPDSGVLN